jgi:hypothetical protein
MQIPTRPIMMDDIKKATAQIALDVVQGIDHTDIVKDIAISLGLDEFPEHMHRILKSLFDSYLAIGKQDIESLKKIC